MKHQPEASKQPLDLNYICKLCGRKLSLAWVFLHVQDDDDDCDGSLPETPTIEVDDRSCA